MEIKQEYHPPRETPPKRSFFSIILDIFSLFFIPFRFAKQGLGILKEDTKKRDTFKRWLHKHNTRRTRQRKLSDEF